VSTNGQVPPLIRALGLWFVTSVSRPLKKALKAVAFAHGVAQIRSHSIFEIGTSLKMNGELAEAARILYQ